MGKPPFVVFHEEDAESDPGSAVSPGRYRYGVGKAVLLQ